MGNIKNFNSFINENKSENIITIGNILDLKNKILAVIANENNENLRKGFDFTINNIEDYRDDSFVSDMCDSFLNNINSIVSKKYPKFWSSEEKGYSGNMFKGSNYEKTQNMDIKEIAKLIKEELSIEFSDWKFSVKIDRYSGGQSIDVTIKDMPYIPFSEKVDDSFKNNTKLDYLGRNDEYYNEKYLNDLKSIQSIVQQYNFDDSDSQTDYFHNRYYGSVRLSDEVKAKFYPENEEVLRSKKFSEEWDAKTKARKAKADEIKNSFKFKKGDKVLYNYDKELGVIPKGEYEAVILKAPNGRGMWNKYDIRFKVDKIIRNGEIVQLSSPRTYETSLYNDNKLRSIE